jgi:hypothetical protein
MEARVDVKSLLEKSLRELGGGPVTLKDLRFLSTNMAIGINGQDSVIYIEYLPKENLYTFRVYIEKPKS